MSSLCALILAGMEFISCVAVQMVLCFGFVIKTVLVIHQCFGCFLIVLAKMHTFYTCSFCHIPPSASMLAVAKMLAGDRARTADPN